MNNNGYYRFPTVFNDTTVFTCEDDLWAVPIKGGIARRLSSNQGEVSCPHFSPRGKYIAFVGTEEGNSEVYVMPSQGGIATRLTYLGSLCKVLGWTKDGKSVLFASNYGQPSMRMRKIFTVGFDKIIPKPLAIGYANDISYGPNGGVVIGRNTADPSRWKRYRGGTAGEIWIDVNGDGNFHKLLDLNTNLASPLWIQDRIYFISDHEGIGNIYSCNTDGMDLQRHTSNDEFYVRNLDTDGEHIIYHAGADIYCYSIADDKTEKVDIEFHSTRTQRSRKFAEPEKYLENYELHPKGHSVAINTRGKAFTMAHWEGAVSQYGKLNGVRYSLTSWLNDGKRLITISDEKGEENLEIHYAEKDKEPEEFPDLNIGKAYSILPAPKGNYVALSNHRNELIVIDVEKKTAKIIDKSPYFHIAGMDWSPDGKWLVYSISLTQQTLSLKICDVDNGKSYQLTEPNFRDVLPSFDPDGKYLYFKSYREFNPVYDNIYFDLNFPKGMKLYLITLQKDLPSPFIPKPKAPGKDEKKDNDKKEEKLFKIDLEHIEKRIVEIPVEEGIFGRIIGIKDKILFSTFPIEGSLREEWFPTEPKANGSIEMYDLKELKKEKLISEITNFKVSMDKSTLIYRAGNRLRVLKAGEKPTEEAEKEKRPSRKSGWLDISRIKISVERDAEWQQMYNEAWRLQRDNFWTEDMCGIDWKKVYNRYYPLIDRISTRSEFSDLIWEMQGELGTSHAYEFGGDYRKPPQYHIGFLGADFVYDEKLQKYRIAHIVNGDPWNKEYNSPLNQLGADIKEGDIIDTIDGYEVGKQMSPMELLVNRADTEIVIGFIDKDNEKKKTITVKTLKTEFKARYREWVEKNREYVHKQTNGKVGYVHIPDMMAQGYSEFHRYYFSEVERDGLIVDVRYNGGGHVSQLILEKLARKRIAYDVTRWGQPEPYPDHSVLGPIVAITNEHAGSDGDIFSHSFKLMKIGPLIGKRTWGGVIGIWPRQFLADGSITTQPEFAFWFKDVGWGVENYGTDPDIVVDIKPQDYAKKIDTQLNKAISEIKKMMAENPPKKPEFKNKPRLTLPTL